MTDKRVKLPVQTSPEVEYPPFVTCFPSQFVTLFYVNRPQANPGVKGKTVSGPFLQAGHGDSLGIRWKRKFNRQLIHISTMICRCNPYSLISFCHLNSPPTIATVVAERHSVSIDSYFDHPQIFVFYFLPTRYHTFFRKETFLSKLVHPAKFYDIIVWILKPLRCKVWM